jgi:hypothetical protein
MIGGGQAGLSMSYCLTERASITSYWTASGPARTGANAAYLEAYAAFFAPAAHPGVEGNRLRRSQQALGQLLEHAALTGQLEATGLRPVDHLADQLLIKAIRGYCVIRLVHAGHHLGHRCNRQARPVCLLPFLLAFPALAWGPDGVPA